MKKLLPFFLGLLTPVCLTAQQRYAVVISEVMADPSPAVALPGSEWIELRNISSVPVNLMGCRLADETARSGPMPAFLIQPGSFVVVCASGAVAALSQFGAAIAVTSFPSLDNDGETISLQAPDGHTLHAVRYDKSWYRNTLKSEGGWSLEMIDAQNPCAGADNWIASNHPAGGTPGSINARETTNPDSEPPLAVNSYAPDSSHIVLAYNEPVDSLQAAQAASYEIEGGPAITSVEIIEPLASSLLLTVSPPLSRNTTYQLAIRSQQDCSGNVSAPATVRTGLAGDASPGDCIINEILFNPRSGGYDYVEFFNNGNKILDASGLYIATRSRDGNIASAVPLSGAPFLLFPGDHFVVTENASSLAMHYLVSHPRQVGEPGNLPSFPDDEGQVIVLNYQGMALDEVHYFDDWHFKLLASHEGVALERTLPGGRSQDRQNWHSAASTAGYGTPTARNSQWIESSAFPGLLTISPKTISPDNDGIADILRISCQPDQPGYIASIVVFDAGGRPVRHLARNDLLGAGATWHWDGLSDRGRPLPIGVYIIYMEIYNLDGRKKIYKEAVVVARRLSGR